MHKLLIVDDEPLIVDNLYVLFRDETDLELTVYSAYSAQEALEILRERKIDILLTDVMMPDLTGLELQARAMAIWPDLKVIFLTGLSDFATAQAGLRMGGVDYVTKNEDDSVIVSAVEVAMAMVDAEIEKRQQLLSSRIGARIAETLNRSYYLERVVNGDERVDEDSRPAFLSMNIPLDCMAPVLVLAMRAVVRMDALDVLYAIAELMENTVARDARVTWFLYAHRSPVLLFQPRAGNAQGDFRVLAQLVGDVLAPLQKTVLESFSVRSALYLIDEPTGWADLPGRIARGFRAFEKAYGDDPSVLMIGLKGETEEKPDRAAEDISALPDALSLGDRELFFAAFDALTSARPASAARRMELLMSIATAYVHYINRSPNSAERKDQLTGLLYAILRADHPWAKAVQEYRIFAAHLFEERALRIGENWTKMTAFVEDYARTHLYEDLSLNRMASLLHFHPVYFSRVYKQTTGVSYSERIGEIRLERAKVLLEDEDVRIQDISGMLGFENPSYFSRFFKRHTGITPQNYRDILGRGE